MTAPFSGVTAPTVTGMARDEDRLRLWQRLDETTPHSGALATLGRGSAARVPKPDRDGLWDHTAVPPGPEETEAVEPSADAGSGYPRGGRTPRAEKVAPEVDSGGQATGRGRRPPFPADESGDDMPRLPTWLSDPVAVPWWRRIVPERWRDTRLDLGRRGALVLAGVGAVAVIAAAAAAHRDDRSVSAVEPLPSPTTAAVRSPEVSPRADSPVPAAGARSSDPQAASVAANGAAELVVSVIGVVEHPGLLHLPPGSRVADAVAAAVARDGADLAGLNLAQRLADGDQIVVGFPAPASEPRLGSTVVAGAPHPPAAPGASSMPGVSGTAGAQVNLNTATAQELDGLTGVGPATAAAILEWRTQHGRFTSIDQLTDVTGIGPAKLERLRDQVTL